jgi:parallel beta-helix repeat protein
VLAVVLLATAPATADETEGEATPIASCQTIDQPGHYALSNDLSDNETCIEITASDVVFDGYGHTITGTETINDSRIDSKAGIYVAGETTLENVTVRDVRLSGWAWNGFGNIGGAVRYDSVVGGTITGVTVEFGDRGVWLRNASETTVTDVVADGTKNEALFLRNGADNNTLTENTVRRTEGRAVRYMNSEYNAFTNNTVRSAGTAGEEGVRLAFGSNWNVFRNNTITGGNGAGIGVGSGSNVAIEDNVVSGNAGTGVYLSQSGENYSVSGNVLDGNDAGISTSYVSNVVIRDNTVSDSIGSDGITVHKSSEVVVEENLVKLSERYGINVRHPASSDGGGIVVANNRVNRSNEVGIRLESTVGNTVVNNTVVNAPEPGLFSPPLGLLLESADNNSLRNNTVQNSWGAINITEGSENNTLSDHTVRDTDSGKWVARITNSTGNVVEAVDIGDSTAANTVVSFGGRNLSVEVADSAPANPSATGIGRFVNVSNTSGQGSVDLTMHYEDGDLSAVAEDKLKLWFHDGTEWAPIILSDLDPAENTVTTSADDIGDRQTVGIFELPYDTDAAFTLPAGPVEPGANVTLDAGGSAGDIVDYAWDVDGDGSRDADGQTLEYAFATAGEYAVTLVVTDSEGNRDAVTRTVSVADPVPSIPGQANPPTNLDDDPQLEDIDGDGDGDLFDALAYYNNRDTDAIENNPTRFDFDGDGESGTLFDALQLFNELN